MPSGMYRSVLLTILVHQLTNTWFVESFKSGAPVSMCIPMIPHHKGSSPQKTTPNYNITIDPTDPQSGIFKVKLHGNKENFMGFMLEARATPESEPIGQFSKNSEDTKTLNCGKTTSSALTHSNNVKREMVETEWLAPPNFEGNIQFIATIVANYSIFWTGVLSPSVHVTKRAASSSDTTPASAKFKQMYDGCGTSKKCVGAPDECLANQDCTVLTTIRNEGNQFVFEMMAMKSKYVAVGLSEDNKMGGDNVLECVHEGGNDSNSIKAYRSWNIPNMKQNRRTDEEQTGFKLLEGLYSEGDVFCKVGFDIETEVEGVKFNLEKTAYYILLAAGKSLKDASVGFHDVAYKSSLDKQLLSETKDKKPHDPIYDGCNIEKNCFASPDGCIEKETCEAIVTVIVQGTNFIFELKGKSEGYVAVGLSRDDKMGGDSVVECVHEQGNKVKAYKSWNKPGEKSNTRRKINQDGINLMNSSFVDGAIYCKYSHTMKSSVENQEFDLAKDKYFLLLAAGSSLKEGGVGFHDLLYTSSGQQRALADVGAFTVASKLLLRLHGSFMVAAWIGCASIGIILARYFKQTWVGSSLCAKDLWFAWHRFFMLLTWCLTLAGFVLIFIELGEWVGPNSQIHAILGCVTTFLCFIQPIGAAFRPHPTARNRPLFNWLHWLIGNSAHIFAIVTIFFAVPLNKAELPGWLDWILVAFVVIYVVMHFVLSCAGCISERENGKRVNSFPMKDISTSRSALNSIDRKQDAPFSGLRKLMLFLHIVSMTAITGSIIIIISLAPIEAQWNSLQDKFMPT